MLANWINMGAILLGCGLGRLLGNFIDKKLQDFLMTAMGLSIIYLGIDMALETKETILVILSLVLGGLLGTKISLEDSLYRYGWALQERVSKKGEVNLASGFIGASLIYCIGSMAVVGSFQAGLNGDYATLFAKSILDGTISLVLVNTLGPGVYLSALSAGLYQGALILFAKSLAPYIQGDVLGDLTGLGGLMILAIGLNMMEIRKIKVGDMLPAIPLLLILRQVFF